MSELSNNSQTTQKKKSLLKNPFFIGFLFGIVFLTLYRPLALSFREAPPALIEVGNWSLRDQNGTTFGSKELEGQVWVANFFFTRCPSICPKNTKLMHKLQETFRRYGDKVHLVSFSVDPEHDSPQVMKEYAQKFKADFKEWTFLTGTKEEIKELYVNQMHFYVGDKEELANGNLYEISHIGKVILFDQKSDIRAMFDTNDEGLGALSNALSLLVELGAE